MESPLFVRQERSHWIVFNQRDNSYTKERTAPQGQDVIRIDNPILGLHSHPLSYPLKLFLNLTKRCNLFCLHCYNNSGEPNSPELPIQVIEQLLRFCRLRGIFKITFAGGEPTLHRNFADCLRVADELGLSISLVTNGLLARNHRVGDSLAASTALRSITVSVDGGTSESHDAIRGRGTFSRTWEAIRTLRRLFKGELAIRCSFSERSLPELPLLIQMAAFEGVNEVKINPINPYGRAKNAPDILGDRTALIGQMESLRALALEVGVSLELPGQKYRSQHGTCLGGIELAEVDADGNLYPCSFSWGALRYGSVLSALSSDLDSSFLELCGHHLDMPTCLSCAARN